MKKVLFLALTCLAISCVSAQTENPAPAPDAIVVATEEIPMHFSIPDQPVANNGVGVNNTINVYSPAPGPTKNTGNKTWHGSGNWWWKEYYQSEYFRQLEMSNNYSRGWDAGFRAGIDYAKNHTTTHTPPTNRSGEWIFWGFVALAALALILHFLNRNTTPPPAAPAAAPVIVYPPAPAPPAPTLPVPPTSSELMKLMKENGGTFKAGSDGSWTADIWEHKKEKPATEAAAIDVKETK